MTQEEKQLLFKDLCVRLPYSVKINIRNDYTLTMEDMELNAYHLATASYDFEYRGLRPYLRPMSSMTKEEENEFISLNAVPPKFWLPNHTRMSWYSNSTMIDWLNAHHFDYRGLIEKGLAIEAPEGMYETK